MLDEQVHLGTVIRAPEEEASLGERVLEAPTALQHDHLLKEVPPPDRIRGRSEASAERVCHAEIKEVKPRMGHQSSPGAALPGLKPEAQQRMEVAHGDSAGEQVGSPALELAGARSGEDEACVCRLDERVHLVGQGRNALHLIDENRTRSTPGNAVQDLPPEEARIPGISKELPRTG